MTGSDLMLVGVDDLSLSRHCLTVTWGPNSPASVQPPVFIQVSC